MKIYVLTDNHAQRDFRAEWGLSFYIESTKNILFDFGDSDLFLKNAEKLGLDILSADHFVLSHGHWDHGNGLRYMPFRKLICHPGCFINRYRGENYLGLPFKKEEAEKKFDLCLSDKPLSIDENITFLGEIPRTVEFESRGSGQTLEDGSNDPVMDDSGIVIKTEKGIVVITGCAHAGICNTVEYAKKVTGDDNVYAVLGGFHLKGGDEVTDKTIAYLKNMNIDFMCTGHCTAFPALAEFTNVFGSQPLAAGKIIEL